MNPSYLYPNLKCGGWEHHSVPEELLERSHFILICDCHKKIGVMTKVEMSAENFVIKGKKFKIFTGICSKCDNCYWTATDYAFLMMMTSIQMLKSMFDQLSIPHTVLGKDIIKIDESSRQEELYFLFNADGKFRRTMWHPR